MGAKNPKGTVSIEDYRGRLRLRWRYMGERYTLTLFANNPHNKRAAKKVALQIELDMINNDFDKSLIRYGKPQDQMAEPKVVEQSQPYDLVKAFELWTREYRQKNCNRNVHYWHMRNILKRWGDNINEKNILCKLNEEKFCPQTFNERLSILHSFSEWMVLQKHWNKNPFHGVSRRKSQKIEHKDRTPFTEEEITRILDAVKHDRFCPKSSRYTHSHYYPFLYFLFKTGVRNGEAVGLRVGHVNIEAKIITIKESMSRSLKGTHAAARVRKETKNDKVRMLPLTKDLEDILIPQIQGKGILTCTERADNRSGRRASKILINN